MHQTNQIIHSGKTSSLLKAKIRREQGQFKQQLTDFSVKSSRY
jgi:hypothetical protein